MTDKMTPILFYELLEALRKEYEKTQTLMQVPVVANKYRIPIGPAAGPHTQLAGNLVAAYAAGATFMELKTVQILSGADLGIVKPCIYVGHEVYNTEWSSELTIEEAKDEYIKAYLLIQVISREYGLTKASDISFIMSVGYDLEGIKSPRVDKFLDDLKDASSTSEWQGDIAYLKEHIADFQNIRISDIEEIERDSCISDTVTLSTMHGCPADEIEAIALHLIEEKGLNTYIKMNPTFIGRDLIHEILNEKGYGSLSFSEEIFQSDINLNQAVSIVNACMKAAFKNNTKFGIKMTNTFPVYIENKELPGQQMYMSGPGLYALSIQAASMLSLAVGGELGISYSGGIDQNNVKSVLDTGISPITVSSYLLKPGGYANLSRLIKAVGDTTPTLHLDKERLSGLADKARKDALYEKKDRRTFATSTDYDKLCAKCHNCVDVCPNRANVRVELDGKAYVIHRDRLCNECGCCSFSCIMGHEPYREKFTYYETEDEVIPEDIKRIIEKGKQDGLLS